MLNKTWPTKSAKVLKPLGHPLIQQCAHACLFLASTQPGLHLPNACLFLVRSRRTCHQSATCGVSFWRSDASCSLWWYVYETFGHVMVVILSFILWHCIWYSLSHYLGVTWSWRTCNLCIWFCLWNRVWHLASYNSGNGGKGGTTNERMKNIQSNR
jgi:hypothetical protein